jgi:hypothetical protein
MANLHQSLKERPRELLDIRHRNFPRVYTSIVEDLKKNRYLINLQYRTVVLLEELNQKNINQLFYDIV